MLNNPSFSGSSEPGPVELSLVVPAYNEEAGIAALVQRAAAVLQAISPSYEIIVVDDGSRDGTWNRLTQLTAEYPALKPISLRVNSGQHIATYIGLRESRGRLVAFADADMTESLTGLAVLFSAAEADPTYDIIGAIRPKRSVSMHRSAGSWVISSLINKLTGSRLTDPASPVRVYQRRVVDMIIDTDILAQNLPILTALLNLKVQEIPLDIPDTNRQSRYSLWKLVHVLLLALLNFSAGTRTILSLISLGAISSTLGVTGLVGLTIHGIVQQEHLSTNLLLLFVLLLIVGLQFSLMGAIAYKLERINTNLHFRQIVYGARHDRHK